MTNRALCEEFSMFKTPIGLLVVVLSGTCLSGSPDAASSYAGFEKRTIKALSAERVAQLEAGHGMGLALAAELNAYPGPKHVIELAPEMQLSDEQLARTHEIFRVMHERAVELGEQLIAAEAGLDRLFASGEAGERSLEPAVARVAELEGRLRYTHLRAHLEMRAALTKEQVEAYAKLRGYDLPSADAECPHGGANHP